jgi:endonuclease YncB( thermonuclease family)
MFMGIRFLAAVLHCLALIALSDAASAETISGKAVVYDGDTLQINRQRVRLIGIDAVEADQTCVFDQRSGTPSECGFAAGGELFELIDGAEVSCESVGYDRFYNVLAHCSVNGIDLAVHQASRGWAVVQDDCECKEIRRALEEAKSQGLGIWAGTFVLPSEWRKMDKPATPMTIALKFEMCDPDATENPCSQEDWTMTVTPSGFSTKAVTTYDGGETSWTDDCRQGTYRLALDTGPWEGTCAIWVLAPNRICFHSQGVKLMGQTPLAAWSQQCVEIEQETCTVTQSSTILQPDPAGGFSATVYGPDSIRNMSCSIRPA